MATATCSSLELLLLLLLWRRRQEKLSVLNGTHISQSVLSHISVLTVESSQAAEHPKAWTSGSMEKECQDLTKHNTNSLCGNCQCKVELTGWVWYCARKSCSSLYCQQVADGNPTVSKSQYQ